MHMIRSIQHLDRAAFPIGVPATSGYCWYRVTAPGYILTCELPEDGTARDASQRDQWTNLRAIAAAQGVEIERRSQT